MLRRLIPLTLLIGVIVAGCSQTPILYAPPTAHVGMLEKAGDMDVSVSLAGMPGIDAQTAISPVDHISLMALYSWRDKRFDSAEHAYHSYLEFGLGTYTKLAPTIIGEFMAGYGFGHAIGFGRTVLLSGESSPAWSESGDYRRYFLQGSLAYAGRKDTLPGSSMESYALVLRTANVQFDQIIRRDSILSGDGWFFEAGFVTRAGSNLIQAESQIGISSRLSGSGFLHVDYFGSLGMRVALQRLF